MLLLSRLFSSVSIRKPHLGSRKRAGPSWPLPVRRALPVIECSPQQIKLAVTGYGGADKIAVARMIPRLLTLPKRKRLDDEFDAIAIGITALAFGLLRR